MVLNYDVVVQPIKYYFNDERKENLPLILKNVFQWQFQLGRHLELLRFLNSHQSLKQPNKLVGPQGEETIHG